MFDTNKVYPYLDVVTVVVFTFNSSFYPTLSAVHLVSGTYLVHDTAAAVVLLGLK